MEEILKVKINVSDEGIVFIDGLLADYAALDDAIDNNSIEMSFTSKNAYDCLSEGYKEYLIDNATEAEMNKKLDFIKFIYEFQRQLAKLAIGSTLKIIESASKILSISMTDTYNDIKDRLNYLEQENNMEG